MALEFAPLPRSVTTPTVIVSSLIPFAGLLAAGLGARSVGLARPLRLGLQAMLALAAWGALVLAVARSGLLWGRPTELTSLWLLLAWLVPIAVVVPALRRTPRLRAALSSRPGLARLAETQVFRNLGLVFLILHARGELPGLFAYPAAWGDVAVGVTAPIVTWALWFRRDQVLTRGSRWRSAVIGWNVLGIADHVVAVLLGVTTYPGVLQLVRTEPTTVLFAELPLLLFPAFMVSFAGMVHLFMLDVLLRDHPVPTPSEDRRGPALAGVEESGA